MRWILYAPALVAGLLVLGAGAALAGEGAWDDGWDLDEDWDDGIGLCFLGDDVFWTQVVLSFDDTGA